jgi:hypothetical protein
MANRAASAFRGTSSYDAYPWINAASEKSCKANCQEHEISDDVSPIGAKHQSEARLANDAATVVGGDFILGLVPEIRKPYSDPIVDEH